MNSDTNGVIYRPIRDGQVFLMLAGGGSDLAGEGLNPDEML